MKIKNNEKGITLIALVVTIIVLIILAGVSINLVLGDNGIITMAKRAKENMEIAKVAEEEMLNTITNYVENEGKIVIEGPVSGGSYDNPYIPTGFTHTEGEGTWNSGYVIKETETGNVFVWVPCVLNQSKVKEGDIVQTFQKTTTGKYNSRPLGLSPTDTSVTDEDQTNAIKTSVGTYGGFYIAAYEAGIEGTKENYLLETKTATNGSVKPLSKAGCGVWNYITRANALIVAASMVDTTDGVKSSLISGECWDTTLQWMVNSSINATNEPNVGYDTDSTGKGWHSDVSSSNTRHTTGYYAVNNIYDMAGNVFEWTTENCTYNGNSYLVERGGDYVYSGSAHPAACRINVNDEVHNYIAFRVVLYK